MSENIDGDIMVTVCIFAYNHERFIEEAIQSVLIQQCDFSIEILIGEDGSSDNTPQILKKLDTENPNRLTLVFQDQSKKIFIDGKPTGKHNFLNLLGRAKGRYIALLDGDDYWTDPLKLQKQVDFLESNEEYVLSYHRVGVESGGICIKDDTDVTEIRFGEILDKEDIGIMDLLNHGNVIHTCSVMFRNTIQSFPYEFSKSPVGDYLLYILLTKDGGKIGKIDESMGVYRRGIGVYSSLSGGVMAKHKLNYLICVMSMLDKESHRKIIFDKTIESLDSFWNVHERIIENNKKENISFKELLKLLVQKFKRKLAIKRLIK